MGLHPHILIQDKENHSLDKKDREDKDYEAAKLVTSLYNFVQHNDTKKNLAGNLVGIKDPKQWDARYMENYHRFFPRTKIVYGLRHPVTWFNRYVCEVLCVCKWCVICYTRTMTTTYRS